jgi:hypothetical protein
MSDDTTPNRDGIDSAVEAAPGTLVATLLVYATSWTAHPMDGVTASAVVMLASIASSYIFGKIRKIRKLQITQKDGA